jgi:hypothetical protein
MGAEAGELIASWGGDTQFGRDVCVIGVGDTLEGLG